jgi:S1-C subfamily serine protease
MILVKAGPIEKFEAWLKPGIFYISLALLILLNLIVWFGWKPLTNSNASHEVVAGLRAERDRIQGLLGQSCTSAELHSYGRGEAGPLPPSGTANGSEAVTTSQSSLVNLLQSAAVVVVHSEGSGSGFFIDSTTVVTNRHVIEGIKTDTVLIASKTISSFVKAKIVSVTRDSAIGGADFALLRLEQPIQGTKALPISSQPSLLQHVVAVGFPGSGIRSDQSQVPTPIYTSGDVSAVQPQSSGVTLIIHTADISPGSSGGALVDRCGSVVGVNTFVQSSDSRAEGRRLYALSADSLRSFLDASGQHYTNAGDCQTGR